MKDVTDGLERLAKFVDCLLGNGPTEQTDTLAQHGEKEYRRAMKLVRKARRDMR